MWPNPQKTADLVTFTEEIRIGKIHFLCSALAVFRCLCSKDWEDLELVNYSYLYLHIENLQTICYYVDCQWRKS